MHTNSYLYYINRLYVAIRMSKHHQRDEAASLENLRYWPICFIDIDGHWWHDGTFEHEGIIAALNQGIDSPTAEAIVERKQWYIEVAGTTPFLGNRLQVTEAGQASAQYIREYRD